MFYGEVIYATIAPLAVLGVIVLAILALSGRSEPDLRGDRPYVLYLSLVSFVALFTLLFAVVDLAATASDTLIDTDEVRLECELGTSPQECFGDFESALGGEQRTRDAINSGAVALVAGGVLLFHRGRSRSLVVDSGFTGSPGARTFTAYLYSVAFVALAIVIVAMAIALPALVRAIAPGITALGSTSAERDRALSDLVPALVAAGGAAVIYLTHWRAADRLRGGAEG